jgi:hypothetical protein
MLLAAIEDLLTDALELDVSFEVEGDLIVADGDLTDGFRAKVRAAKPDLLAYLRSVGGRWPVPAVDQPVTKPNGIAHPAAEQGSLFTTARGTPVEGAEADDRAAVIEVGSEHPSSADTVVVHRRDDACRELERLAERSAQGDTFGFDFETSGLDPVTDRARLMQIGSADGRVVVIDLFETGGLPSFASLVAKLRLVAFPAAFEGGFLAAAGIPTSALTGCLYLRITRSRAAPTGSPTW